MEQEALPLGYYCRSARLCLRKAALARKCQAVAEEIEHLRNCRTVVSESILLHPLYSEKKGDKQILELQGHLADAKKRLSELETDSGKGSANSSVSPLPSCKNGAGRAKSDRPVSKMQRPGSARGSQEIHVPQTPPGKSLQSSPQKFQWRSSPRAAPSRLLEMPGPSERAQRKGQAIPKGMQDSARKLLNSKDQQCISSDLGVVGHSSREKSSDLSYTCSDNPPSSPGLWQERMPQCYSKDLTDESPKPERWDKYVVERLNSSNNVSAKSKKLDKSSVTRAGLSDDVASKSKEWEREVSVERCNSSADESSKLALNGKLDILESRKHGKSSDVYGEVCLSPLKVSNVNGECSDMEAGLESCVEQNFVRSVAGSSKCENFIIGSGIGTCEERFPEEFEGNLQRNGAMRLPLTQEMCGPGAQPLPELNEDVLEKGNGNDCGLEDTDASFVGSSKCRGFLMNEESSIKSKFESTGNYDIRYAEEGHGREKTECRNKPEDWKALLKRQANLESVTECHSTLKVGRGSFKTDTLEGPEEIPEMSEDVSGSSSSAFENPIKIPVFDRVLEGLGESESKSLKELVLKGLGECSPHDDRYLSTDSSLSYTPSYLSNSVEMNLSCDKTRKKTWNDSTQICQIVQHADIMDKIKKDMENNVEMDCGTSKRAREIPREQTKGDIEGGGYLKMDGREASDDTGVLKQDALDDKMGGLSLSENQIAHGEKLVTKSFSQRKGKRTGTSSRRVKFEGLDEIDEGNLPVSQELTQLCKMEQHVDIHGEKSKVIEKYDLVKHSGTSKRAGEMCREQIKGDIEEPEHPKIDGKGVPGNISELTRDALDDDTGRVSLNENQVVTGEKLVTKFLPSRKGTMGAENVKRINFEGLDERYDTNFPNTQDEIYIDKYRSLGESCDNGMMSLGGNDRMTSMDNEPVRRLESKNDMAHSPKAMLDGTSTLSCLSSVSYVSEPRSVIASTSLSLSGNNEKLRTLEQEKHCGFVQWPPRSSKMPASGKLISHLKRQFYDERQDLRIVRENEAHLDQTTFSNPVFDFESHDNKTFPMNNFRIDSAVSLRDDEKFASILCGCTQAGSQMYQSGDRKDWASGSDDGLEMGKIPEVKGNKTGDNSATGDMDGNKVDRNIPLTGCLQTIIDKNLQRKRNLTKELRTQARHQHFFYPGMTKNQMDPSDSEEECSLRSFVACKTTSSKGIEQNDSSDQSMTGEEDFCEVETMQGQSVVTSPMMLEEAFRNHCTSDLDQMIKVANLQDRMGGLQRMVQELKDLVETLSVKSKAEDKDEQYRLECLANDIKDLKEETGHELFEIRKLISDEIKMKLEQIKSDTLLSRDTLQLNISECSAKLQFFQEQIDSEISEAKLIWINSVEEKLAKSVKTVKDGLKNDVEHLEHELFKDMKRFKELIDTELAYLKEDCTMPEKNAKQGEALIEEKLEKWFSNKFNTLLITKIDALLEEKVEKWFSNNLGDFLTSQTDVLTEDKLETWFTNKSGTPSVDRNLEEMKNELCLLKAEVNLSKITEEIHRHAELVAEATCANLQSDQSFLKSENDSLKKQLEALRNEGMHTRLALENFKKEFSEQVIELRHVVGRISNSALENEIQGLRELEEGLELKIVDLTKRFEKTEADVVKQKADFEACKQVWEGTGMDSSSRLDSTQERTLIMQRVESLSQLYLGGLEEIRSDLLGLKLSWNARFEEQNARYKELQMKQENKLANRYLTYELLLDGRENQLAQLKSQELLGYLQQEKIKVESILGIMTKDKDRAATMAAEAAASAQKAEEFLNSVLRSLNNEIVSARWNNTELQESLTVERNTVAAFASEAKRMYDDLHKEKEAAFGAMSESQKSSQRLCEEIEQEWKDLKLTLVSVGKEMQLVNAASSRATAVAVKSEAMLSDITNARIRTMELVDGLSETVSKAVDCVKKEYIQEVKSVMDAFQRTVHVEVANAKAVKQELEELKEKISPIHWFNVGKGEKLVVHSELEHFVQKSDLDKSIKEAIGTKGTSSPSQNFKSIEEQFATKEEFEQLTKKLEWFAIAKDGINQNNCQFAMGSLSQESENTEATVLRPEIIRLERQIKQMSEKQCALGEKVVVIEKRVWKIEDKQTNICDLMDQFQASMIDLEACESPEQEQIERLYKDVEGIAERLRQVQDVDQTSRLEPIQEREGITGSQDIKKRELVTLSEKRLFTIENRIEHVASAAHTNLWSRSINLSQHLVSE